MSLQHGGGSEDHIQCVGPGVGGERSGEHSLGARELPSRPMTSGADRRTKAG